MTDEKIDAMRQRLRDWRAANRVSASPYPTRHRATTRFSMKVCAGWTSR
jgi:hypothetical protein